MWPLLSKALLWGGLSVTLLAALLWGPLHDGYERACQQYPVLRGTGPMPAVAAALLVLLGPPVAVVLTWLGRGVRSSRRLARSLDSSRAPAPAGLAEAARRAGYSGPLVCLEGERPLAFCLGLLRPRVYVTTALVDLLGPEELAAVLAHEGHHVRARDPLRFLLARSLCRAALSGPEAEEALARYRLRRELLADDAVVRDMGAGPLASALLKTVPGQAPAGAVGLDATEARVRRLLGQGWEQELRLPWGALAGRSLLAAGLGVAAFALTSALLKGAAIGCAL